MSISNPNWVKIRTFTNAVQAEIIKQMLVENNTPAVLMNRQDSSYLFGVIELYVDVDHQVEAAALIDSFDEEDQENEN
ncbi:hypothetical protein GCM10022216_26430 [Sphingobacterium kyonggiense]|uniref:DUF2007 domain-containing protein n=1 Tax=Sphingobacterium kyonggiense TaxID=714075 RepID=A0ABP7YYY8_9SPHI